MSLKFKGSYLPWQWRMMLNWRGGTDLSFQNRHEEFDKFWPKHSKTSKICTLMGSFWSKYIMFELKNHTGVIFDGIEDW